jgi:hypothetical protein
VEVVEEKERQVQPAQRRRAQVPPAGGIGPLEEIQAPGQRHRVLEVRAHRDGDPPEHGFVQRRRALVAPRRQVHEGEMPQQMVAEIPEVVAGMDARRQRLHAAVVLAGFVEDVGNRVHRPGVLRVQVERALGQRQGLGEAAVLLQAEGVKPQHVGIALEGPPRGLGELEHLRRPPLPEVDVVEPL